MKLPGSQVHPPFCIAVSEPSPCQTQWGKAPEDVEDASVRFFWTIFEKPLSQFIVVEEQTITPGLMDTIRRILVSSAVPPPCLPLVAPAQHGAMLKRSSLLSADGQNPTKRVSLTPR